MPAGRCCVADFTGADLDRGVWAAGKGAFHDSYFSRDADRFQSHRDRNEPIQRNLIGPYRNLNHDERN